MAESHRDEIAKLEALHAGHPEGRVFTHLAEAYRRAGDVARARQILDEGLSRHPDYPSAHVVMGRLLAETGEVEEAAAAFRRVLELDRHNVVALRSLAEMADHAGRRREALHYYEELSRLDPANESLRGQIRDLEAAIGAEPSLASWTPDEPGPWISAPEQSAWLEPSTEHGGAPAPGVEEPATDEPIAAAGGAAETIASEPPGLEPTASEHPGPEPPGLEPTAADGFATAESYEPALDESFAGEWVPQDRWDRFARGDAAEAMAESSLDAGPESEPGPDTYGESAADAWSMPAEPEARDLETPPEEAVAPEEVAAPEAADVPEEAVALETRDMVEIAEPFEAVEIVETTDGVVIEETVVASIEVEPGPADVAFDEMDEGEVIDEWVTETMAEVYAAQGLTERAVEVYRLLTRSHPSDDRISARLAELEESLAGPATPDMPSFADDEDDDAAAAREAWLASVESAWTGGAGADTSADETLYAWAGSESETHAEGSTAGDLFRALLGWRPTMPGPAVPSAAGAEASELGAAGGAHADFAELLLEEEGRETGSPAPDAPGTGDTGSVASVFEELFGDVSTGRPGWVEAPAPPVEPAAPLPRPVDQAETEQDLEMFRTWLQSLKK